MTPAVRLCGSLLATGLALGLALACLASTGALAARSQPWERHNAAGLAALEARRFAEAGQRFAVALREAERQGPETAAVAATTHAPLTAILIVYEITQSYQFILPLMLAATVSTAASQLISRQSIYTLKLARRGVRLGAMSDLTILRRLSVSDVRLEQPALVHPAERLARLPLRCGYTRGAVLRARPCKMAVPLAGPPGQASGRAGRAGR